MLNFQVSGNQFANRRIGKPVGWLAMLIVVASSLHANAQDAATTSVSSESWSDVSVDRQAITTVAPWTGVVLWNDHESVETDAVALEYAYVGYDQCYDGKTLDFTSIDQLLSEIASRKHQAILRFHFVYPGKPSRVPDFLQQRDDYRDIQAKSEGEKTGFVDWSCPAIEPWLLDFYTQFAAKFDSDPRLAYLQTGFGLWAEYHIYDGPRKLGETFPTKDYQKKFLTHMASTFTQTPWSLSVDAADDQYSPITEDRAILKLPFGIFDDSFLCKPHKKENEQNWNALSRNRYRVAPAGGEFSYYNRKDQKNALAENGPNGESFESAAKRFHLTYIIGNDQPKYQSMTRIKDASMAIGYRMQIRSRKSNGIQTAITVANVGIAPMYHDAYLAIGNTRSSQSLKSLMPGEEKTFVIDASEGPLSIQSDRLADGMQIPFETK